MWEIYLLLGIPTVIFIVWALLEYWPRKSKSARFHESKRIPENKLVDPEYGICTIIKAETTGTRGTQIYVKEHHNGTIPLPSFFKLGIDTFALVPEKALTGEPDSQVWVRMGDWAGKHYNILMKDRDELFLRNKYLENEKKNISEDAGIYRDMGVDKASEYMQKLFKGIIVHSKKSGLGEEA